MFFCFVCVENRFIENKKEAAEILGKKVKDLIPDEYLYQYADIKINILMNLNAMSLICECQFLLKMMQNAKKSIHTLYEVTRNADFVSDMSSIISIANSKQEEMFFLVHSGDVESLSQFLMAYMDEVNLSMRDKHGLNVFHYTGQLGNVRMLRLLLNVTKKSEWNKYLNTPAQTASKPLLTHLAVMNQHIEMVKELKRMCKMMSVDIDADGTQQQAQVLSMESENGNGQTPMDIAIDIRSYFMIKTLYDEEKDNSAYINEMIEICADSIEEYDRDVPNRCKQFLFFSKLLETKKGIDGTKIIGPCLQRPAYFKHLFEVNERLSFDEIWNQLGRNPNFEIVKYMLDVKKQGFDFGSIQYPGRYYEIMTRFGSRCVYYWGDNITNSDEYKCYEALLETVEMRSALRSGKAKRLMTHLLRGDDGDGDIVECIEKLVEMNDKDSWNLDFSKPYSIQRDSIYLIQAIRNGLYRCVKYLLNTGWFNINAKCGRKQATPLLECIASTVNYEPGDVFNCANFKIFNLLLDHPGIDVNIRDDDGNGFVGWCQIRAKQEYINRIVEKYNMKNEDSDDDQEQEWKINESMIRNEYSRYEIADKIIRASSDSVYEQLKSILDSTESESVKNGIKISDVINIIGPVDGTALSNVITTMTNYDKKNPLENDNFKCLKLLLDQKGIKLNIVDNSNNINDSIETQCLRAHKVEFYQYLVKRFPQEINKNPMFFATLSHAPSIITTYRGYTTGLEFFSSGMVNFNGFKTMHELYPMKMENTDVYSLICGVASTTDGWNKENELDGDNFKIFEYLLDKHAQSMDVNMVQMTSNGDYSTLLMILVAKNKVGFVKHFLQWCDKNGKKIDYSKHCTDNSNGNKSLLYQAVETSNDEMVDILLKLNIFDMDIIETNGQLNNLILENVLNAPPAFNTYNPQKCFEILISKYANSKSSQGLMKWVLYKNNCGLDTIDGLVASKRDTWLNFLQKQCNEIDDNLIQERRNKQEICDKLVVAAAASDLKQLKDILNEIGTDNVQKCINGYGMSGESTFTTPLLESAGSRNEFNASNQENCENFECFKLILSNMFNSIDNDVNRVNIRGVKYDITDKIMRKGTVTVMTKLIELKKNCFLKYLINYGKSRGYNFIHYSDFNVDKWPIDTKSNLGCLKVLVNSNLLDKKVNSNGNVVKVLKRVMKSGNSSWRIGFEVDEPFECSLFNYLDYVLTECKENDLNTSDKNGETLFNLLIKREKFVYMKYIIDMAMDNGSITKKLACKFNIKDLKNHVAKSGINLLVYAAMNGEFSAFEYLVNLDVFSKDEIVSKEYGIENNSLLNLICLSKVGYSGQNVLHCDNYKKFVFMLEQSDVDPYQTNKCGHNAFDLLTRRNKGEYLKYLDQWVKSNK